MKPKITYGWTQGVIHTPDTRWAHFKIFLTNLYWTAYTLLKWGLYALALAAVAFLLCVAARLCLGTRRALGGALRAS